MMNVFISYSRRSRDIVELLAQDIKELGNELWIDQELSGGQVWWDQVLAQIRACDLFIFALARESLDSYACKLEFTYAFDLHKRIMPVLVADGVSINLLPPALSTIQYVDYRRLDRQAAISLNKALNNLPPPQPLPDPLPESPEVPISYLGKLREQIETTSPLSFAEQTALLSKLKHRRPEADELNDVAELLTRLRKRDDLFAKVADEIDDLLTQHRASLAKKSGMPTAPPASPYKFGKPTTLPSDRPNRISEKPRDLPQ